MTLPAISAWLDGQISPGVALARLVFAGMTPEEIGGHLPIGSELARLFATHQDRLQALAKMLRESEIDHAIPAAHRGDILGEVAAMFDRAVALSPEASVAAYSLGDGALLARATQELVDWLLNLIPPEADVLDVGCGIGRVAGSLAPHVRSVLGLDVSAGMIAEARRRHTFPNLRFAQTDGRSATELPPASFDLVLFADSMPYLVQAGIAHEHVAEARRLLRPGGYLVILNLSYRGDEARDAADARDWAASNRLQLAQFGERLFRLWDGIAYVFTAG